MESLAISAAAGRSRKPFPLPAIVFPHQKVAKFRQGRFLAVPHVPVSPEDRTIIRPVRPQDPNGIPRSGGFPFFFVHAVKVADVKFSFHRITASFLRRGHFPFHR
jgi:hypothetical protein